MNFSIIIPFRNEKENLGALLKTLHAQITRANYEIIMIDDFSQDGGGESVESFCGSQSSPVRTKLLRRKDFPDNPKISSKQNALDIGANFAQYEYLLFTDADMVFDENWIENYNASIEESKADFVFGRTGISNCANILDILQKAQLDFLFSAAFVFCKLNLKGSAMGNNLAVSASAYKKIGTQAALGFSLTEDKKLLDAAKKIGMKISCTKDFRALAFTKPLQADKFFHQTLRWVKGGMTEDKVLAFFLIVFALGNLLILPSFIIILLLLPVFLKHKTGLRHLFLLPFAFFAETLCVAFGLFFVKLRWKNRRI